MPTVNFLTGVNNLLISIENNWTVILVIFGLLAQIYMRIKNLIKKVDTWIKSSEEEKISVAKAQIKQGMLKYISDAEMDYNDMTAAGQIKRSQVIKQIYSEYPVLSKIVNQDELVNWIDTEINSALKDLRKIIKENNNKPEVVGE